MCLSYKLGYIILNLNGLISEIKRKKIDTSPITKVRIEVWSQHNHNSIPPDIHKTNNK